MSHIDDFIDTADINLGVVCFDGIDLAANNHAQTIGFDVLLAEPVNSLGDGIVLLKKSPIVPAV